MPRTRWTEEKLLNLMSQFEYQKDFRKAHKPAYLAAFRRNLIPKANFKPVPRKLKWDFNKSKKAAASCANVGEFKARFGSAYNNAKKYKWLDDFFPERRRELSNQELIEVAKGYDDLTEFRNKESNYYSYITKRPGLLETATRHMKRQNVWRRSLEDAKKIIASYDTLLDFYNNEYALYLWCQKKPERKQLLENLEVINRHSYTLEEVKRIALRFDSPGPFSRLASGAWSWAKRSGHWDDVTGHMERKISHPYALKELKAIALSYPTPSSFQRGNASAYNAAHRLGIFLDITKHMERNNGVDPDKATKLYYIRIESLVCGVLYKIGITQLKLTERYSADECSMIVVVKEWLYDNWYEAHDREQKILRDNKKYKYKGEPVLLSGNSEIFRKDVLQLDFLDDF